MIGEMVRELMEGQADLYQIIDTFGTMGILIFMVLGLVKGWVVPKDQVDKIVDTQRESFEKGAQIIADEVKGGMQNAVKSGIEQGIAAGYLKIAELNKVKET